MASSQLCTAPGHASTRTRIVSIRLRSWLGGLVPLRPTRHWRIRSAPRACMQCAAASRCGPASCVPDMKRQRKVSAARVCWNSWWHTHAMAASKSVGTAARLSSSAGLHTSVRWHISKKAVSSSGCASGSGAPRMNAQIVSTSPPVTCESALATSFSSASSSAAYVSMACDTHVRQPMTGVLPKTAWIWPSSCGSRGRSSCLSEVIARL
mmetsp:Transcript_42/g.112  ORF Transcript_42/g.112 Transcript_42/m.112 type:complete len:209 (+) Transcript_42:400-1026(+)